MSEVIETGDSRPQVWIRPPEWTKRTGMSRTETYRALYEGRLRSSKVGKMWFIAASELNEFFERCNEAA